MSHRFWRVRFNGVAGTFLNIAELQFFDRNFNRVLGGVPSGSLPFARFFPVANAFDGLNNTLWSGMTAQNPYFLGYDFLVPTDICFVRAVRELNNNNFSFGYEIDFSDDGANWTYTGFFNPPAGNNEAIITPTKNLNQSDLVAATDWRFLILAVQDGNKNANVTCGELQFLFNSVDMTVGGVASAKNVLGGFVAANAFDKNPNTLYASLDTGQYPYFLGYSFTGVEIINGLSFSARTDGFIGGNFKHGVLQYFDPLNEIWITAVGIFNEPAWTAGETRVYNFVDQVTLTRTFSDFSISRFKARPFSSYFIMEG